jgi:signal transduction histidine kinase
MKLASRLMLVSLVTLVLPWAGCSYLREVESSLRLGQAERLAASANAIAGALEPAVVGPQLEVGRFGADRTRALDVYAHRLSATPVMDGFIDDWGVSPDAINRVDGPDTSVRYAVGERSGFLYFFLEVTDSNVVYGGRPGSDRVRLALMDADGLRRDLVFATSAPGELQPVTPDGRIVRRARANWQATSTGFNLEIALPGGMAVARAGFMAVDARSGGADVGVGTLPDLASEPGWLLYRSAQAESSLARSAPPDVRLRLIDRFGYVLADTGWPREGPGRGRAGPLSRVIKMAVESHEDLPRAPREHPGRIDTSPFQSALAGEPVDRRFRQADTDRVTVASARSLHVTPPAGAMLLAEQDTASVLSVTDRAARKLVVSSLAASLAAVTLLFGFAVWLSWRIRRLSAAMSRALGRSGEIASALPDAGSGDELGELSRSFSRLLEQVAEYNAYLQTLGQKLTHEMRTPMTVVKTSLENLESTPEKEQADRYIRRARRGVERLQSMMTALGAATRVEQAISSAQSEAFDIGALVRDMSRSYATAHPERTITGETPPSPCEISGSPDLVAQMLDKLFENALDFCPPDGRIDIRLVERPGSCVLSVANSGSELPKEMSDRLFDSLVSARPNPADGAHLGLGLHIARLIARHHGGRIGARNLPDSRGVEFWVELPPGPGPGSGPGK